jgi:hypothetical protein
MRMWEGILLITDLLLITARLDPVVSDGNAASTRLAPKLQPKLSTRRLAAGTAATWRFYLLTLQNFSCREIAAEFWKSTKRLGRRRSRRAL